MGILKRAAGKLWRSQWPEEQNENENGTAIAGENT
jgi:hypothetical protein